jgi:acyl-CoA reductase-like NAD-dependent aldehyde dehydrogenase
MRKLIPMLAVAVLSAGFTLVVKAAEEKTIEGMAQCAKCALKETKQCQNVVVVEEDGKDVKYYLVHNDVAKKAHGKSFCQAAKDDGPKVKVTGDVSEKDGKKLIEPTKIEVVEE